MNIIKLSTLQIVYPILYYSQLVCKVSGVKLDFAAQDGLYLTSE